MRRFGLLLLAIFLFCPTHFFLVAAPSQSVQRHVLPTPHKGLLLESNYVKHGCCDYTITNKVSIDNSRLDGVEVRWLSAALTTGELFSPQSPAQPCVLEYSLQLLLGHPIEYDAADLFGVDYSVIARLKRYPPEKFNAAAYAPPARIMEEGIENILRALPLGKVLSLTSEIRMGQERVVFVSTIRRISPNENKFEYRYIVTNDTNTPVTFQWTSVMYPEFRRANGIGGTLRPTGKYTLGPFVAGPAAYVNDVALLSSSHELPRVEFLGDRGTYSDRLLGGIGNSSLSLGLRGLPIGITVLPAPAFDADKWIRQEGAE